MRKVFSLFLISLSLFCFGQLDSTRGFQQIRLVLNTPIAVSGEARPGLGFEFLHYAKKWGDNVVYLIGGIHLVNTANLDSNSVYDFDNQLRTSMYNHSVHYWEAQLGVGYRRLLYKERFGLDVSAHFGLGTSRLHGVVADPNKREYTYWEGEGFTGGVGFGLFYVANWNGQLLPISVGMDWNQEIGEDYRVGAYSYTGALTTFRISIGWLFC